MQKPNEILQVTCVICGNPTARQFVLCPNCYKTHKQYMRDKWFIELISMQRFQDYIDTMERYTLDKVDSDFVPYEMRKPRKKIGAPKKTNLTMKERARSLKKKGYSLRKIGKILSVSYETVRTLLSN